MKKHFLFLWTLASTTQLYLQASLSPLYDNSLEESDSDEDGNLSTTNTLSELTKVTNSCRHKDDGVLRRTTSLPEPIKITPLASFAEEEEETSPLDLSSSHFAPSNNPLPSIEDLSETFDDLKRQLLADPCFESGLYQEPLKSTLLSILNKNYLNDIYNTPGLEPRRSELMAINLQEAINTLNTAIEQRDPLRLNALEDFFSKYPNHESKPTFERIKKQPSPFFKLSTLYFYLVVHPLALEQKTTKPSKKFLLRASSAPLSHEVLKQIAIAEAFPDSTISGRASSIKFADDDNLARIETFNTDITAITPKHPHFSYILKAAVQDQTALEEIRTTTPNQEENDYLGILASLNLD